jgi:hypothetical protein
MIVSFITKRLAFGRRVRLYRHVAKLRELGFTHVIDVQMYSSRKLRAFTSESYLFALLSIALKTSEPYVVLV